MTIEYGRKYDFESVREEIRSRQLHLLDTFVAICETHRLTYWLDGGTLLGSVRHQGFIPWDDDIDVGMMRSDYERLLEILPDALPGEMVMQTRKSDPLYPLPYLKIRDRYSRIEDRYIYNGIFIDIFPFDTMPKKHWVQTLQRKAMMVLEAMYVHTDLARLNIRNRQGIRAAVVRLGMRAAAWVGSRMPPESFERLHRFVRNFSEYDPGPMVGDGLALAWAYEKSLRPLAVYVPTRKGIFGQKEYDIPSDCDAYLRTLFGENYLTPVVSENVHISYVEFFLKETDGIA
jgi:lipopolysaccharide cholinephosphotransferase